MFWLATGLTWKRPYFLGLLLLHCNLLHFNSQLIMAAPSPEWLFQHVSAMFHGSIRWLFNSTSSFYMAFTWLSPYFCLEMTHHTLTFFGIPVILLRHEHHLARGWPRGVLLGDPCGMVQRGGGGSEKRWRSGEIPHTWRDAGLQDWCSSRRDGNPMIFFRKKRDEIAMNHEIAQVTVKNRDVIE